MLFLRAHFVTMFDHRYGAQIFWYKYALIEHHGQAQRPPENFVIL
jgi:hypothetical protein